MKFIELKHQSCLFLVSFYLNSLFMFLLIYKDSKKKTYFSFLILLPLPPLLAYLSADFLLVSPRFLSPIHPDPRSG